MLRFPFRNSLQAKNKFSNEIISSKTPLWKIIFLLSPPPTGSAPLVHKVGEFYKLVYLLGPKIPKRDRFGLYHTIETGCLELITLLMRAALTNKTNKSSILETARIQIEILKLLIRTAHEISIFTDKQYLRFEGELQTISKMLNGWIKYISIRTNNQ